MSLRGVPIGWSAAVARAAREEEQERQAREAEQRLTDPLDAVTAELKALLEQGLRGALLGRPKGMVNPQRVTDVLRRSMRHYLNYEMDTGGEVEANYDIRRQVYRLDIRARPPGGQSVSITIEIDAHSLVLL